MLCRLPEFGAKFALTVVAALNVTLQLPAPEHPPPQPEKVLPAVGVSVRVTDVLAGKFAEHEDVEQLIPAGLLVTVPLPAIVTVNATVPEVEVNIGVTVIAADILKVQLPVPEQPPPLHPVKEAVELGAGVSVSLTCVPVAKLAMHSPGQDIPDGLLLIIPEFEGGVVTVNRAVFALGVNAAVTVEAELTVRLQLSVPEHPPPLQPAKKLPAAAVAVSVTTVPLAKLAAHCPLLSLVLVLPVQLIPAGVLVTVPEVVPEFETLGGVTVN